MRNDNAEHHDRAVTRRRMSMVGLGAMVAGAIAMGASPARAANNVGPLVPANNLADLNSLPAARHNIAVPTYVATRSAMAALSGATDPVVILNESGRQGLFEWNSSNASAAVTVDTQQGIFVAPASDTSGASGAWQRVFTGSMDIRWFGAVGDNSTDCSPAIQSMINLLGLNSPVAGPIFVPIGWFRCNTALLISNAASDIKITGAVPARNTNANSAQSSSLFFAAGINGIVLSEQSGNGFSVGFELANLNIMKNTNDGAGSGTVGVKMIGVHSAHVHDCNITNFDECMWMVEGAGTDASCYTITVERCRIEGGTTRELKLGHVAAARFRDVDFSSGGVTQHELVYAFRDPTGGCNDVSFEQCTFNGDASNHIKNGFYSDDGTGALFVRFIGCDFEQNVEHGIAYNSASSVSSNIINIMVTNCWFNCQPNCVAIGMTNANCLVTGCRIYCAGTNIGAIVLATPGNVGTQIGSIISGNMITITDSYCIQMFGQIGGIITGNVFVRGGSTAVVGLLVGTGSSNIAYTGLNNFQNGATQ